jgi:hypothetical protein
MRKPMSRLSEVPSQRAWAIAAGLVRTRRAATYEPTEGFIRADSIAYSCARPPHRGR